MSEDQIKPFNLRMPASIYADLELMAQEDERSVTWIIVSILKAAVAVWKAKQKIAA